MLAKINGRANSSGRVSALGAQAKARQAKGQIARSKPQYYAQILAGGAIRSGQIGARVLVLGSPDNPTPIGTAYEIGSDDQGLAEWTLNVRNVPVPGRFVIVDREFWLIGK